MPTNEPPVQVLLTQRFKQDLKKLAKRYRSIRQDVAPLLEQLQQGQTPGDEISGNQYQVIKVRLKNSNIQKGKSAGYRVVYYLKTKATVILVTVYSKSDQSDVSNSIIESIIQQFEQAP